jgi:hypothetical protein
MKNLGFILTLDVMVALIVAAVLITMILYFVSEPKLNTGGYLYDVCDDFLAVAQKDGSMAEALDGAPGRLDGFMDSMPANLCLNLTISDVGGADVYGKSNCPQGGNFVICRRTVVNGTSDYASKMRVGYR